MKTLIPGVNFEVDDTSIKEGFNNFIKPVYIDAPNTEILNRAQVLDQSNTLKSLMPVERIMIRSISLLEDEFGPNGEPVYEIDSKDSRIRVVGGWRNITTAYGTRIDSDSNTDIFIEVTFYGTGLNLLYPNVGSTRDFRPTIDGGAEGSTILSSSESAVIGSRGNNTNQIKNVTSGLALGWHTVKLRVASVNLVDVYGFEIINEDVQSNVLPGEAYSGLSTESLAAAGVLPFKPAALTGTTGARVVNYFDIDDATLKQAFTEVPASPSYLGSTDHSNEVAYRRIHFSEFSANRADDFSAADLTDRDLAFTLGDGTTTLQANNIRLATSGDLQLRSTGSFIIITFIGTGLDMVANSAPGPLSADVYVDGVIQGTYSRGPRSQICSGLPYGTHTVKIQMNAAANQSAVNEFIIYEPKKPTIPVTAIELEDYNVLADFSGLSSPTWDAVSQGVIRKKETRERIYSGNWTPSPLIAGVATWDFDLYAQNVGDYQEQTFFGTGFEFRDNAATNRSNDITVEIDGVPYTGAATVTPGFTWTPGSSQLGTKGSGQDAIFRVEGLPMGFHTVRLTMNTSGLSDRMQGGTFEIIAPTHKNDKSLKNGGLSSEDVRAFSPIAEAEEVQSAIGSAKALLLFDQNSNQVLYSKNISAVIDISAGTSKAYYEIPFKNVPIIVMGAYEQSSSRIAQVDSNLADNELKQNLRIRIENTNTGGNIDGVFALAVFGELANEE